MTEVQPSITAKRVAAYRLGLDRLPTPYGDPDADEALARDVAAEDPGDSESMARYLRGRTTFFDRIVVNAPDRGVNQIVVIGAGYDGRSLRYARPGGRWWEVDRPETQADKRARLARLGIDTGGIEYVAHDLNQPGLSGALVAAGYQPDAPGLFLCEGVAVYLEPDVLRALLVEVRALATVGSRIALSLGTTAGAADGADGADGEHAAKRERFQAAVAAVGEPALNSLNVDDAEPLLAATRWRFVKVADRVQRAGFVMATPVWSAPDAGALPTLNLVGRFTERMLYRAGSDTLADHLASTYGVDVRATRELDLGVHRVERADGSTWIARVFPATRDPKATERQAATLGWLAEEGFPAERCADAHPVSSHQGQPVLVTRFAGGRKVKAAPAGYTALGELLARLHTLDAPALARHPGGAWHHLVLDAGLAEEKRSAIDLLASAAPRVPAGEGEAYERLAGALTELDDLSDLPHAFNHPDPVPSNYIDNKGDSTLIDWTGAGWTPRLAGLGCLLWAAGSSPAAVDAVVAGYGPTIELGADELDRLEQAMVIRPLILDSWGFATGRGALAEHAAHWEKERARIKRVARRARQAFTALRAG